MFRSFCCRTTGSGGAILFLGLLNVSYIAIYLSSPPIGAVSVPLVLIVAVSVCVSGIHSWTYPCSHCLCLRELLLVFSVTSLSVSLETTEVWGDGWVWGWSGACRLLGPMEGYWSSLSAGGLPLGWPGWWRGLGFWPRAYGLETGLARMGRFGDRMRLTDDKIWCEGIGAPCLQETCLLTS